jgi:fatty acid desaturase
MGETPPERGQVELFQAMSDFTRIHWYRTPLDKEVLRGLSKRSDGLAWLQVLGHLGFLALTGGLAVYSAYHWPLWVTLLLLFVHGTGFSFMINAVHELGHRTVFQSRRLNEIFLRIFAFLGWIHFPIFRASHARHHEYTLHPPDDLEVVLPMRVIVRHFFQRGIVNVEAPPKKVGEAIRIARGRFKGEWENRLFPADKPAVRREPVNWARTLLAGHALIVVVSLLFGWWMVPVVISLAPFYGSLVFILCNSTQHIGMQDNVPDFRLCCRTLTLNPIFRFLYWHMNYHTEHHMYPSVPCYRLGALHRAIKHDLPPCPAGLIETWRQILAIQRKQKEDPTYQYVAPLPETAHPAPSVRS